MQERNYLIDSIRLVASVFVVFLHLPIDSFNEELAVHIRLISRWAVPVFFMISGYFISIKVKKDPNYFFSYFQKILGIIIIATIIYLPLGIKDFGLGYYIYKFDWLFLGSYYHLWFLSTLLFSSLIFSVFFTNNIQKVLDVFSIILLVFFILLMGYGNLFGVTINQNVPLLYVSVFFFNLGSHLHKIFSNTFKSKFFSITLIVFGIILQEVEVYFLDGKSSYNAQDFQMLFGTVILSLGIIGSCFSFIQTKSNMFSLYGKKYALFIYIYHVLLVEFFKLINVRGIGILFLPFLIVAITIFVALFLERKMPKIYKVLNGQFK